MVIPYSATQHTKENYLKESLYQIEPNKVPSKYTSDEKYDD
jgi:hypothetical protein